MDKETALKIGAGILGGLVQLWKDMYSPEMDEFDWWYGIAPEWDINIYWCDVDKRLEGSLYSVDENGNTTVEFDEAIIIPRP